jgi:16S rRNA (cytidine1402-2'-O)-methyltransferase
MAFLFHIGSSAIEAPALAAGLYLVATPIGNLGDVTLRALQTLAACDYIYCEDTRVTVRLLDRYGIRKSLRNCHDHNEAHVAADLITLVRDGKSVALVSDAGTPLVADPGFKLVREAIAEGIPVTVVPGASALLSGLQLSGLASDRFCFIGYLPEKQGQRRATLEAHATQTMTVIAYESPHRIVDALADIALVLPTRTLAVARELTKLHEEVLRGTASDIQGVLTARESIRGEFVVVIAPLDQSDITVSDSEINDAITLALVDMTASKAAAHVAKELNLNRQDIYARIVARKETADGPA